jgi:hypothetical protein
MSAVLSLLLTLLLTASASVVYTHSTQGNSFDIGDCAGSFKGPETGTPQVRNLLSASEVVPLKKQLRLPDPVRLS